MSIQELNCDNAMALEKNLDSIRKKAYGGLDPFEDISISSTKESSRG